MLHLGVNLYHFSGVISNLSNSCPDEKRLKDLNKIKRNTDISMRHSKLFWEANSLLRKSKVNQTLYSVYSVPPRISIIQSVFSYLAVFLFCSMERFSKNFTKNLTPSWISGSQQLYNHLKSSRYT